MILGVPVLSRYDLLEKLLESAEDSSEPPCLYLIVDNGGHFGEVAARSPNLARALARGAAIWVLAAGENLGVAASWNAILLKVHPEPVVIANDDVVLGHTTLADLHGAPFVIAEGGFHANGWCLFRQTAECAARVGLYDERFHPAYYEDRDYERRLGLAGIKPLRVPSNHSHAGWATLRQEGDDGPIRDGQRKNLAYYERKWGGSPGEERFAEPFDGAQVDWLPKPRTNTWTRYEGPMMRYDVVNRILKKTGWQRYLEIGVSDGDTIRRITAAVRVGVDPEPRAAAVAAATDFFSMTSDAYFASIDEAAAFDVTFIDGLHHADQAYRDIESACRHSKVVVVHDANPSTESMQAVPAVQSEWTGDVWKAVARVRAEGRHAVRTIDTDYGVAVIVSGGREDAPTLPRVTWNDLVQRRADLLGLVSTREWEAWFDAAMGPDNIVDKEPEAAKKICLNMIVKNEAAIIERCLDWALPFIDTWVIADTGSTDDTVDRIERFFAAHSKPGKIVRFPFKNFAQARNEALTAARTVPGWDYALLLDADMQVDGELDTSALRAPAYKIVQRDGTLEYWNTRLLRRDATASYVGVTHEFLSVEGAENLPGLFVVDRGDGGSKGDKGERDIRLLSEYLTENPQDERSLFYLAQTYRGMGRHHEAIQFYRRRIARGGWDEEVWASLYGIACAYRDLGDEPNLVKACVDAYEFRPTRGEPLKVLARWYRERSKNESAFAVAETLATVAYPSDELFVERDVYDCGADQEISIAGYWSKLPARREAGYRACARLTVSGYPWIRDEARKNFTHYVRSAKELFGAEVRPIDWQPGDGYAPMNPSVCVGADGRRLVLVRTVNYTVTSEGQYPTVDGSGIIRTRNHVVEFDADWRPTGSTPVEDASGRSRSAFGVEGFEDCRLWQYGDGYCASATVRDSADNPDGRCEMTILSLDKKWRVTEVHPVRDYERDKTQKNWMPVSGFPGQFLYLCDPTIVIDAYASSRVTTEIARHGSPVCLTDLRGGSQLVAHDGGWLCVTHEVAWRPERVYLHRFVKFDTDFRVVAVSDPWYFRHVGIEFCAGLARDGDRLVASFGVNDASAHLALFEPKSVDRLLRPVP